MPHFLSFAHCGFGFSNHPDEPLQITVWGGASGAGMSEKEAIALRNWLLYHFPVENNDE